MQKNSMRINQYHNYVKEHTQKTKIYYQYIVDTFTCHNSLYLKELEEILEVLNTTYLDTVGLEAIAKRVDGMIREIEDWGQKLSGDYKGRSTKLKRILGE